MFAQPADSGISIAVANELLVPDPIYAKAMEIINDNSGTTGDNRESCEESSS